MPLIRCSHCGEDAFSIEGWADLDHCPSCGRPLARRPIEHGDVMGAKRLLKGRFSMNETPLPSESAPVTGSESKENGSADRRTSGTR
jgi:hypothetical protein